MKPFHHLMLSFDCSYCGAAAWEPCRTITGVRTSIMHAARFYAASDYRDRHPDEWAET